MVRKMADKKRGNVKGCRMNSTVAGIDLGQRKPNDRSFAVCVALLVRDDDDDDEKRVLRGSRTGVGAGVGVCVFSLTGRAA
jgi:hypothetical protein